MRIRSVTSMVIIDENFVRAVTMSAIAPKNTKSYTGRSTGSIAKQLKRNGILKLVIT